MLKTLEIYIPYNLLKQIIVLFIFIIKHLKLFDK